MEKKVALVNKQTKRVKNIILVASFDDAPNWATDLLDAIAVSENETPYVYGKFIDGEFLIPENEYLIEIGVLQRQIEESDGETL